MFTSDKRTSQYEDVKTDSRQLFLMEYHPTLSTEEIYKHNELFFPRFESPLRFIDMRVCLVAPSRDFPLN
jgi:hypothetical protein